MEENSSAEESSEQPTSEQESSSLEPTLPEESSGEQTSAEQSTGTEPSSEILSPSSSSESSAEQSSSDLSSSAEETSPEQSSSENPSTQPSEEPTPEPTPEPTAAPDPTDANGEKLIGKEISKIEQATSGDGSKEAPYLFRCGADAKLDNALLRQLVQNQKYAIIRFYNESGMPAYDLDLSKMIMGEDDKPIIHTHNYIEESRTEATCLSPAIVTYRCDGCTEGYVVQEGEKAGHTFVDIVNNPATCVTKGYLVRQCSVCGVLETEQTDPDPNAHQYVLYYDGGTTGQWNYYQCSVCGATKTEQNPNYVPPTIAEPSTEQQTTAQSAYNISEERTAMLATASIRHGLSAVGGDDGSGDNNGLSSPSDISLPTFQNEDFSSYTAEELAKEIQSQRESLRDMDLERRKLELEYTKQQKELSKNGIITSTVTGVVEEMQDVDNIDYTQPFAIINGGEGYYVQGTVTEDLLDTFVPGMEISCTSWSEDSTIFCTAVVTEVSEYPTTDTMGGSQNPNLSYYPFVAYITPEDGKGLTNGSYIDISLTTQGDTDSLYISQMYVKKEDNRYFVYARNPQTGLLEKRYVTIGKSLYGSYYQIKSGLTNDDMIAVPFGKTVKEGVKTTSEYSDDSMDPGIDTGLDTGMDGTMYDDGMIYDASMGYEDGMNADITTFDNENLENNANVGLDMQDGANAPTTMYSGEVEQ